MATSVAQSWPRDLKKPLQLIESMRISSIFLTRQSGSENSLHTPLRNLETAHVKRIVARQKAPQMATSVTRSSQIFLGKYSKVLNYLNLIRFHHSRWRPSSRVGLRHDEAAHRRLSRTRGFLVEERRRSDAPRLTGQNPA
jgi:hypothetical protein